MTTQTSHTPGSHPQFTPSVDARGWSPGARVADTRHRPLAGDTGFASLDRRHRLALLAEGYRDSTPGGILRGVIDLLGETARDIHRQGELGIEPFASMLRRGDNHVLEQERSWIEEHRAELVG